jgi:predicted ester cyclase
MAQTKASHEEAQGNAADSAEGAKSRPLPVTDVRGNDIDKMLAPAPGRRQPLAGFDETFVDIVDWIVRVTHWIWCDKNIGLIYDYYLDNSIVHVADGTIYGREPMVIDTVNALAAYPVNQNFFDDVVWTGNDHDGFYTSHRYTAIGRNTGCTSFGPPTHRQVRRTGIALCYLKDNRIIEEWSVRDDLGIITGLGYQVEDVVARLAEQDRGKVQRTEGHGGIERLARETAPAPFPPKQTEGFDVDDFVRRTMHEVWNRRMFGRITDNFIPNYRCHTSRNTDLYGRGEYIQANMALLVAFPDGQFFIDQVFWMEDGQGGYRTSMLWSFLGTHTGYGIYGPPTGERCRLWGVTQHHIKNGKFVEEWTYHNELAILKQLYLARHP